MSTIYHIAPRGEWEAADGQQSYTADSLATEGFIHCSEAHQVVGVANRLYRGRTDLLLLELDPERLTADVRYERGGGDIYPHIYGVIDRAAVVRVIPFPPRPDGAFELPVELGDRT